MATDKSLTQELDAMAALGQILGDLTDSTARQRVLNWATERFAPQTDGAQADKAWSEPLVADPALAVDSLDDMFAIAGAIAGGDVDSDFSLFEESEPLASRLPIEVVVRSFAADFQRFAEEWNGATA